MNNIKLSFFENIYYWIWYYIPNFKYGHHPTPALACTFLSVLKSLNFFWILILLSAILKNNIAISLFGDSKIWIILGSLIMAYFLVRNDEKRYEERFEIITEKMEILTQKERNIKRVIFFVYTIVSLAVCGLADTLVAQYNFEQMQ